MGLNIIIRISAEDDINAIKAIYDYEIYHGLATFDETPRSYESHLNKRAEILAHGLPHLVAELDGKVIGYSYAAKYRGERTGYRYTIENSVFLDKDHFRKGVGSLLMSERDHGVK